MEQLILQLRGALSGTISTSQTARTAVRRDGSLFESIPDAVMTPATAADVSSLVKFVVKHKTSFPKLAITARGAGTDMSGAAIGSSIILDTSTLSTIQAFNGRFIQAQPGARIDDMQRILYAHNLTLASAPSNQHLTTLGGMVANNSASADSFRHGTTERWVRALKVVLADGNEYVVRPLNKKELDKKMAQPTYEGRLYAHLYSLLNKNYDLIRNARPHTTKNTSGYNLWNVWDKENGVFDLTQLFTGSQGTLGIITEATLEAVKRPAFTGTLLVHIPSLRKLDLVLSTIRRHNPLSIEGFDDLSFMQALQSHTTLRKRLGKREYIKQQARLTSSALSLRSSGNQLLLAVTVDGDAQDIVLKKIESLYDELSHYKVGLDISIDSQSQTQGRRMRQSTLALIQDQITTWHASPFIDDMAVHPTRVAAFLPRLQKILKKYSFPAIIHGHFGDGNFHIVPLKDVSSAKERAKLEPMMRAISALIIEFDGTLSGEHGDGMIRGPWLPAQFNQEVYALFKGVKELFDPLYIFNPHKKTDASWEYSMSQLRPEAKMGQKR